jgi:hypothetical protein
MRNSLHWLMLSVLVGTLLSGCGGGGSAPPPNGNGTGNPLPSVSSISPSSAIAGGAPFTLTVTGSNFVSGSVVNWAGTALTTTFGSSTSLSASVPASNLSTAGTAQIAVTNPTPGGGTSAAKNFDINNPAPVVASLSQTSTDVGSGDFILTVDGSGFVPTSVVRWNGSTRATSFSSGTQLTATVTASDLAIAGSAQVSVANPTPGGGNSSALTFTVTSKIAHGIGLPGAATDLAINATSELRESDVNSTVISGNLIMNRLDVRFARDATVDQVNTALGAIGAGIVHMSQGFTSVTIAIPQQSSPAGLQALVEHLETFAGIRLAKIANVAQPDAIFPNDTFVLSDMAQQMRHLLPSRFPAAWNLAATDFGNPSNPAVGFCPTLTTPVLVNDIFDTTPDPFFNTLFASYDQPAPLPASTSPNTFTGHGYFVSEVLGANGFGANPFSLTSGCEHFTLVQHGAGGSTPNEATDYLVDHMPAGRFVVNLSMGSGTACATSPCTPPHDTVRSPLDRADDALYWKEKTRNRWNDFLIVASAGNYRDAEMGQIYPGMGDSRFNSRPTISQLPDNLFTFLNDDTLWTPAPTFAAIGYTSFKPTAAEQAVLAQEAVDAGMSDSGATANNVIVVGSVKAQTSESVLRLHVKPEQLFESSFSNAGPDVLAVGEHVFPSVDLPGTSFSAPQVAGLISYLWMISRDLGGIQPISVTKRAILANARNGIIDAYATALSLDGAGAPSVQNYPKRFKLLNVNEDDKFDDKDIEEFLHQYFQTDTNGNISDVPAAAVIDFSQYDLNGDGFTGGSTTERFDLDRTGSTQYGTTVYSTVLQNIGGDVSFNENQLTDLQILCYYAYSPLYGGTDNAREPLLAGRCNPVTVTVDPGSAIVPVGSNKQFSATVHGTSDPRVTWTVSGNGNSISASGLLTAGNVGGTFTVRAVSVADPSAFGEATVNITDSGSGNCTLPNFNYLSYFIANPTTFIRSGHVQTNQTLADQLSDSTSFAGVRADYGSIGLQVQASGLHPMNAVSGPGTQDGGAQSQGEFGADLLIIPENADLHFNTTGSATITFKVSTAQVGTSPVVSGDRAVAHWIVNSLFPWTFSTSATLSTVTGQSTGDFSGGTFSVTAPIIFGQPNVVGALLTASVDYACVANQSCSQQTGLTGAGAMRAGFTWLGVSKVRDQSGNELHFSVCSTNSFN